MPEMNRAGDYKDETLGINAEAVNHGSSQVCLRLADMKDLGGITALEMDVFSHPWNEDMVASSIQGAYDHVRLIETAEGEIAGYIIYSAVCDSADLLRVAVDAGSRRCGIGRKLMEAMIDDCRSRDVQSIFLEVRESNAAAIAMYEQFGFVKISTRKKYYDSPVEDGLVMQKQL